MSGEDEINGAILRHLKDVPFEYLLVGVDRFIRGLTSALVYLRDQDGLQLTPMVYKDYSGLPSIEKLLFKHDLSCNKDFIAASAGLNSYLLSIPNYTQLQQGTKGRLSDGFTKKNNDHHGIMVMHLNGCINLIICDSGWSKKFKKVKKIQQQFCM